MESVWEENGAVIRAGEAATDKGGGAGKDVGGVKRTEWKEGNSMEEAWGV